MWTWFVVAAALSWPASDHECHLLKSDWWSEGLTIEATHPLARGTSILARTDDNCVCRVLVPDHITHLPDGFDITIGHRVISAGWQENGDIVIEKLCESFEGCVASRNE